MASMVEGILNGKNHYEVLGLVLLIFCFLLFFLCVSSPLLI